jgi:endonuclease YncB( thermonuclease family)
MRLFPIVSLLGAILLATPSLAASAVVRDGDTIQLGDVTYRLDGVDAPELDQICINDQADPWSCGIEARDQLAKLIGSRDVHCDDLGPDKLFRKRHIGVCTVQGDGTSLNLEIAQMGLAIGIEPSLKVHAKDDVAKAQADKRGLWKGCLVAPQEFRLGKKDGALIGGSCRADRLRHQGQARRPGTGDRQCRHLPSARLPELCRAASARPLVLLGRRCAGRGLPPRLQLPRAETGEQMISPASED